MSEIIIEKLLEQRDFYLNLLKHLDFEFLLDPSQKEIKEIEKRRTNTIDQLKKIEQEIAFLLSKKSE
jgi:GH43 family beta-xylosidase